VNNNILMYGKCIKLFTFVFTQRSVFKVEVLFIAMKDKVFVTLI